MLTRTTSILTFAALVIAGCGGSSGGDQAQANGSDLRAIASVQMSAGDEQAGVVGEELPGPIVARALDATGAPVVGQIVNFKVTLGGGSVFAGAAATDQDGYARERWTMGKTSGPQELEVRAIDSNGLPVVYARFRAAAISGPPSTLTFVSGIGQTGQQLLQLTSAISVRAADRFDNAVADTQIDFATPSGGFVSLASARTDSSGIASTAWTLGPSLGAQYLFASTPNGVNAQGIATSIAAPPGAPAQVMKSGGDLQVAMQHTLPAAPLEVVVVDSLGNPVPNIPVAFSPVLATGLATSTNATTDASGKAAWRGYVHSAGAQQIQAHVADVGDVIFQIQVAASPHAYDGFYNCILLNPGQAASTPNFFLTSTNGLLSGVTSGGRDTPTNSSTLNEATGELQILGFKTGLDSEINMYGAFQIDSDHAVGSGTTEVYVIRRFSGNGAWTCDRL